MSEQGYKRKGGGLASKSTTNAVRANRIRAMTAGQAGQADEFMFLAGPGRFQCRLCYTFHISEESYVTHSRGRKHLQLVQRFHSDSKKKSEQKPQTKPQRPKQDLRKRPEVKFVRVFDKGENLYGVLAHCKYEEMALRSQPHHRVVSCFEQSAVESKEPCQFLVVAAEGHANVAVEIPLTEIMVDKAWSTFNHDTGDYYCQVLWKG